MGETRVKKGKRSRERNKQNKLTSNPEQNFEQGFALFCSIFEPEAHTTSATTVRCMVVHNACVRQIAMY